MEVTVLTIQNDVSIRHRYLKPLAYTPSTINELTETGGEAVPVPELESQQQEQKG